MTTAGTHAPPASSYPFQVWVIDGGIDSGYKTITEATNAANRKNNAAESMGLRTRYEVRT